MRSTGCLRHRRGFSLIDIIIALLLLGLGVLSVVALTAAGIQESHRAIGLATAQATARSALYDPKSVDPGAAAGATPVTGYSNGYFVQRTILQPLVSPGIDLVQVRVFWGDSGRELAGLVSLVQR